MNKIKIRKTRTIPTLTSHIERRSVSGTRGGVRLAKLLDKALLKRTKIAGTRMRAMTTSPEIGQRAWSVVVSPYRLLFSFRWPNRLRRSTSRNTSCHGQSCNCCVTSSKVHSCFVLTTSRIRLPIVACCSIRSSLSDSPASTAEPQDDPQSRHLRASTQVTN